MLLTPLSFLFRLLILILTVLFSSVFLQADEEEEDTLEETEEEATGPLQIKQQTALCSADYYIKGGTGDKEEDRKRREGGEGGEGSEAEDTILLSTTNQKYHIEAIDESTTNTIVEKFNIKFERNSNED